MKNSKLPPEDVEILTAFVELSASKYKKNPVVRIKVKNTGEFISLGDKGKSSWPSIGAAKNALRLHFPSMFYKNFVSLGKIDYLHKISDYVATDWKETEQRKEDAYQEFITDWIEFDVTNI